MLAPRSRRRTWACALACLLAVPAVAQRKKAPEANGWATPKYDLASIYPEHTTGTVGQALTAAWDGLDWTAWRRLLAP